MVIAAKVERIVRCAWPLDSSARRLTSLACLACATIAQVPALHPNRNVHPGIATPATTFPLHPSPMFAVPDGVWNHGEAFGSSPEDHGGWFGTRDGTDVTIDDVHVASGDTWVAYPWNNPFLPTPASPPAMFRIEGYLRPPGLALPTAHPLYGAVGPYVDQAAFELFRPQASWSPATQQILLVVHTKETCPFPLDYQGRGLGWRQIYRGYFSADGLVRNEVARTASSFIASDALDGNEVDRPVLATLPFWNSGVGYWPIEAYVVLTVMGRSTTLNEQRYMQLVQAVKCMLQASDHRNPLWDTATSTVTPLTPQEVESRVVVVFTGGSNGGMQSGLAALRYPHLVHGAYAEVINPSYQRLYAEHDLSAAITQLTAGGNGPFPVAEDDFLTWNQYVWSQHLEMHDMSALRHFVAGTSYRPMCFVVGDEDITSTGTNWVRVLHGTQWQASGLQNCPSLFGSPSHHTMGWAAGSGVRHAGNFGPVGNPYLGGTTYYSYTVLHDSWPNAIAHRAAELAQSQTAPVPALQPVPRSAAQQLRGLDDPQEWWLGRLGDPMPGYVPPLQLDTAFVAAANPGATGCVPGTKEAMFIKDQRVYVGSVDGFVSRFHVDTTNAKLPLVRDAQSPRLGHECFGLQAVSSGGTWWVVAGTRRHLHKLDKDTLQVQQSVQLPWEVAQPHHIRCADVLPGHSGPEIVFATVHGGLCFYDLSLQPIHEWCEPGIYDFFIDGGVVTFLSARGLIASVSFSGPNHDASLLAASKSIPQHLVQSGAPLEPSAQGGPVGDIERMLVNWGPVGFNTAVISLWQGDEDGNALRGHWLPNLGAQPYLTQLPMCLDITTCMESTPINDTTNPIGDHVLVLLTGSVLRLYNQFAGLVGEKSLTSSAQGHYPFGARAHHIAVGDLVGGGPSGPYSEEVVIATNTGLMWMYINELVGFAPLPATAGTGGAFGSGFWVEKNGPTSAPTTPSLATTNVQARTNQSLTATWAMARRPAAGGGLDGYLHVLSPQGVYWKVGYNGHAQLWDSALFDARSWEYVGPVSTSGSLNPEATLVSSGSTAAIKTQPWCPINSDLVGYQLSGLSLPHYIPNNWQQRDTLSVVFDGFCIGGSVVPKPSGAPWTTTPGLEVWQWSFLPAATVSGTVMGEWGNLLQGLHMSTSGQVDGIWASTHVLSGDKVPYLDLHSRNATNVAITQQAAVAVNLQNGAYANQTAVVLGCPGGRVRVLLPGSMRPNAQSPHVLLLGPTPVSSDDFGLGGSALAVRHEVDAGGERLRIWFGTLEDACARPASYGNPYGTLADAEVSAGAVHVMTWSPGSSGFTPVATVPMQPTPLHPRGASAVVGMLLTDLLPASLNPAYAGDELVVATLSGDVIVYAADTMQEHWRSHVPGAVGCYNSIRAEDLDSDSRKELYVAGSVGLWRFVLPGELQ